MKKLIAFTLTLAASLCVSVTTFGALSLPATIDKSAFKLEWSDEFNGTELNSQYWNAEIGNGTNGWGNNELQYYTGDPDNVNVSNGTLKITALAQKKNGYNYTSARLQTAGKVEVGYGYCEARIKIPSVSGVWPAFWMLGANEPKGWPMCGEIDIMESWNTDDFAQSCLHYADDNSPYYETEPWRSDNWSNFFSKRNIGKTEWHTYGVYKTKTHLAFYIDGQLYSKVIDITNPVMTEMHNDYYFLLNIACGGNLTQGQVPNATNLNATMEVDYVRYYAENPTQTTQPVAKQQQTTKKVTKPARVKITKAKNVKKKKINLKFKKVKGAKGYQIRWCDNKKFQGYEQKTTSKTKVTLKGLSKKSTYRIKVRAYKLSGKKKMYGLWSKVKKVKVKK